MGGLTNQVHLSEFIGISLLYETGAGLDADAFLKAQKQDLERKSIQIEKKFTSYLNEDNKIIENQDN